MSLILILDNHQVHKLVRQLGGFRMIENVKMDGLNLYLHTLAIANRGDPIPLACAAVDMLRGRAMGSVEHAVRCAIRDDDLEFLNGRTCKGIGTVVRG